MAAAAAPEAAVVGGVLFVGYGAFLVHQYYTNPHLRAQNESLSAYLSQCMASAVDSASTAWDSVWEYLSKTTDGSNSRSVQGVNNLSTINNLDNVQSAKVSEFTVVDDLGPKPCVTPRPEPRGIEVESFPVADPPARIPGFDPVDEKYRTPTSFLDRVEIDTFIEGYQPHDDSIAPPVIFMNERAKGRHNKRLTRSGKNRRVKETQPEPQGRDRSRSNQPSEAPDVLKGFPDAVPAKQKTPKRNGGGLRERWKTKKGIILEWDSCHGMVEKYDKRGNHLGEFYPDSGKMNKGPKNGRRIEP